MIKITRNGIYFSGKIDEFRVFLKKYTNIDIPLKVLLKIKYDKSPHLDKNMISYI